MLQAVGVALTAYREVLRTPSVGWLLGTSIVGRLPMAMESLAIVLLVAGPSGAYADAGFVVTALVAGTGLAGPLLGRAVDRWGRRPVLPTCAVCYAALMTVLATLPSDGALLPVVALAAGFFMPPMSASARSLWPVLLTGSARDAVYSVEATFQEVTYVVGPALVAGLSALAGPRAAVGACGVFALVGTVAFTLSPAVGTTPRRDTGTAASRWGIGVPPGMAALLVTVTLLIVALSMTELGVIADAGSHHDRGAAGLLLAVWSLGSGLGGLLSGGRATPERLPTLLLAAAVGIGVLALPLGLWGLGALLFVGGATIAPSLASLYGLAGRTAPEGRAAEAFGWLSTAAVVGGAAGASLGGATVEHLGPGTAYLLAAAAAACAALLAAARARRARRPRR